MIACSSCGATNQASAGHCRNCGALLAPGDGSTSQEHPPGPDVANPDPGPSASGQFEDWRLAAGIQNVPGLGPAVTIPGVEDPAAVQVMVDPTGSRRARLFSEVLAVPSPARLVEPERPRKPELGNVARYVVYAALIAAVTLPLLFQWPLLPRSIEPSPAVVDLYDTIGSLNPGAAVLIVFDYDPATSGEMDPLARAIVGHLMEREAHLLAISLLPAGAATAHHMLNDLSADRPAYRDHYGESLANLGYVPGSPVGVRLLGEASGKPLFGPLASDFYGNALSDLVVMDGVTTIQDLDLIIELAAGQDTLRWWIEQAVAPHGTPMGVGVSVSVEPLARPYYETDPRQLVGMAGGVLGAAMYETLRGGLENDGGGLSARLDAQLAGHLLLIVVILVGNGVRVARSRTGRSGEWR